MLDSGVACQLAGQEQAVGPADLEVGVAQHKRMSFVGFRIVVGVVVVEQQVVVEQVHEEAVVELLHAGQRQAGFDLEWRAVAVQRPVEGRAVAAEEDHCLAVGGV